MDMTKAYPMKSGDDQHSYIKNSYFHRGSINFFKEILNEVIVEKLDVGTVFSSKTFCIADLGCSVGQNTFAAVGNIIEAVKSKYQSQGQNSRVPEFQIFFNDHVSNDFNLLLESLPPDKQYYAAGVPRSFYGRIFPEASLHFVHSSYSVQWFSGVPKEVKDKNSPAWNKGHIHYGNSGDEVIRAYKAQYEVDMDRFLKARASEIVVGGLMVLMFLFKPNGMHLIGSSLNDLARKERVSMEKVDSFNVPMYFMSPEELKVAVERNGCFSIERVESMPLLVTGYTGPVACKMAAHMRAGMEDMIKQQFGDDIVDELFDLYAKKLDEILIPYMGSSSPKGGSLFVALKRKA